MEGESVGDNASLINSFCEITSSSREEAIFFLESHNFDLDAAVSTFFDNNNNNATANNNPIIDPNVVVNDNPDRVSRPILTSVASSPESPSESHSPDFSPSQSPSRSRSASPTLSRAPYELRSRRNRGKSAGKASGSRSGRIRTLSDLKRSVRDSSDSDSDETQEYYTGGEKSGMLVQDPTKGNSVDDFFNQARQSAVDVPSEHPQKSTSFTGAARLLSGETVHNAAPPPEVVTHTITFWRNGFSVDDGPLRRLDDPQNASFLESVKNSECPRELEPADRRTSVHVDLIRLDENYPEPAKPRHLPFHGVGRTLGSSSSTSEAAGEPIQTTVAGSTPNTAPLPSMGLVVDESQPVTSIQLRLADGTRMVSRFNHHHTIRDVRAFIDASRPGGARTYQLQTMGFPPTKLADLDQTIEQAGIANSVVIQRL
ncbi:plant UBX domain-containing protein 4-like [Prosopis cineraria]|uniref:plant UBX domain-containing protein 4-like n=1 Tax=Prosopis cineraria TaxID=364024 RepID=UPI00240F884E|nr:plant UBX domain-containing protein 4-like [Prosopis cineraria]